MPHYHENRECRCGCRYESKDVRTVTRTILRSMGPTLTSGTGSAMSRKIGSRAVVPALAADDNWGVAVSLEPPAFSQLFQLA